MSSKQRKWKKTSRLKKEERSHLRNTLRVCFPSLKRALSSPLSFPSGDCPQTLLSVRPRASNTRGAAADGRRQDTRLSGSRSHTVPTRPSPSQPRAFHSDREANGSWGSCRRSQRGPSPGAAAPSPGRSGQDTTLTGGSGLLFQAGHGSPGQPLGEAQPPWAIVRPQPPPSPAGPART